MAKEIKCVCGGSSIEHSHGDKWKCGDCGRFHDSDAMDRLADQAPAEYTRLTNKTL